MATSAAAAVGVLSAIIGTAAAGHKNGARPLEHYAHLKTGWRGGVKGTRVWETRDRGYGSQQVVCGQLFSARRLKEAAKSGKLFLLF